MKRETLQDGTLRSTRVLKTPRGTLRDVQEIPRDKGPYRTAFFVEEENDLPAFEYFMRRTTSEVVHNSEVRRKVARQLKDARKRIQGAFPTSVYKGRKVKPLEGKSLLPVLKGMQRKGHEALFWNQAGLACSSKERLEAGLS